MFLALVVLLFWPVPVLGESDSLTETERIESFSARISILPQGDIEVTETVVVLSHGDELRHFKRLLPRWSRSDLASDYEITDVHRDGAPEEYQFTDTPDGLQLIVGDPDSALEPGRYVYSISYKCSRLIQSSQDWEGLVWNATGVWPVPVEKVSVQMEFARAPLPGFNEWSAAVGRSGQAGGDWAGGLTENNLLEFETTRPLEPGESMVVQVSWPPGYAAGGEREDGRILFMDSRAILTPDRWLDIREEVTIYNDGKYQDGFTRNFTLTEGNRVASLDVKEVLLNGEAIPWELERISGGRRLLVEALPQGKSTLTILYALDRQITFGDGLEQLRWTLPGDSVDEVIDQARFTLELPWEIRRGKLLAAYTEAEEDLGNTFWYQENLNTYVFASTQSLQPGESMVSSATWPDDQLPPVTWKQKLAWQVRDNAAAIGASAVMLLLIIYFVPVWARVGRRPLGKSDPVSTPPEELSPAALRYLRRRGYDKRAFTSAVLSLAVKGCLMIVEEDGKYAYVSSGVRPASLPEDEEALLDSLFSKGVAVFTDKHEKAVNAARRTHRRKLVHLVRGELLRTNRIWLYPMVVLSVAATALLAWLLPVSTLSAAGYAGFVLWCAIIALAAVRTADLVPGLIDDRGIGPVFLALGAELLAVLVISYLWAEWLTTRFDVWAILPIPAVMLINSLFSRLLAAPTAKGREILAHAKGFRAWLTKGGAEVFPGGLTRFEQFLPYTIALDISNRWGRRFGVPRRSFSPRWYQGSRWHTLTAETLAASVSTLPKSKEENM